MNLTDFETRLPLRQFIEQAHRAFFIIRESDSGISDLRLRKGDFCKKLVEEIFPIANFLGSFERVGLNVECQYFSGDQSFDAKIYCDGLLVDKKAVLNEYFLEVSLACHPKDFLKRQALEQGVPFFGGYSIEKTNGIIHSTPEVHSNDLIVLEHLNFIQSRINKKAAGCYPDNTYLIIPLFPDSIILWDEWIRIIGKMYGGISSMPFSGIFVYDIVSNRKCLF